MRFAIDFDGTIVEQNTAYDDVVTPLKFVPGAKETLLALRDAGHSLLLWSARASRALREDQMLDPLVKAGVEPARDPAGWEADRKLNEARYQQMLAFVEAELPGVFHAIDDGTASKPSVDMFVDDRAFGWRGPSSWGEIRLRFG